MKGLFVFKSMIRFVWRESRGSRLRLLLLSSTTFFGIALFVALGVLAESIRESLERESRSLLGADLVLTRREPWDGASKAFLTKLPGEFGEEISFVSMVSASPSGSENAEVNGNVAGRAAESGSRLAMIRAVTANMPFYGEVKTTSSAGLAELHRFAAQQTYAAQSDSVARTRDSDDGFAFVERSILLQSGATVGGRLKIGEGQFKIVGVVEQVPGDSPIGELIAPRVYISRDRVESTNLLRYGSRATYRFALKLPDGVDAESLIAAHAREFDEHRITAETVKQRRRSIEDVVGNVEKFLSLAGLSVLVLASFGLAHGISSYLAKKAAVLALLRCLGASRLWTAGALFLQIGCCSLLVALSGGLAGLGFVYLLPGLLSEIVPFEVILSHPLRPLAVGVTLGVAIPLSALAGHIWQGTNTPPITLLGANRPNQNLFGWLASLVLVLLVIASERGILPAIILLGICIVACLVISLSISMLFKALKPLSLRLPISARQAVRQMSAPGNRARPLSIGFVFAFLVPAVMIMISSMLTEQMKVASGEGKPNTILFGVDPQQVKGLRALAGEYGTVQEENVPIISMRLRSIRGVAVRELMEDSSRPIPEWTLRREYRSTYRRALTPGERLLDGEMVPTFSGSGDIPITIEKSLAEKLRVKVLDRLVFDVQGLELATFVSGLREVSWQQIRPNFFIVFPEGVLEQAPQTAVLTLRIESELQRQKFEQELLQQFPNVSFIDLRFVLKVLDSVLSRLSIGAEVVGSGLVVTAILVCLSLLVTDGSDRGRDFALLKVLGATRSQIRQTIFIEYLLLGFISALTATILAFAVGAGLLHFVFNLRFVGDWAAMGLVWLVGVVLITVAGVVISALVFKARPVDLLHNS